MKPFSATDAAFAGFRLIRQRPMLVVVWTLVSLGLILAIVLLAALLLGSSFMELARLGEGAEPSVEQVTSIFLMLVPLVIVALPVGLLYAGVMAAGVNRAILRPDEKAFFYLRLGADEFRQAVVLFVQGLGWMGVYLLCVLIVGLTAGFGALASGVGGDAPDAGGIGAMIGSIFLVGIGGVALALFLMVKFSLASAQTFQTRQINIFGSWSLTKGRFWPILGAFLLAFVFIVMISIAQSLIQGIGQMTMLSGDMATIIIGVGIALVISSLISTVIHLVAYAPAPTIYKAITSDDTAADVFT
jgi:hypothetical protein